MDQPSIGHAWLTIHWLIIVKLKMAENYKYQPHSKVRNA